MKKTIIDMVEEYARALISSLPSHFTYHNLNHTISVVEAVDIIADKDTFSAKEREILKIAAWFHDTGFVKTYRGHEQASIDIAKTFLKKHGFAKQDILAVSACIKATKITHEPKSLMEKAIRDADVCHLACDDYFNKLSLLKEEWEHVFQQKITDEKWFTENLNFLTNHRFETPYCKNNLKQKKQKNLFKNFQKVAGFKSQI